jgi:hypothetical protein
MGAGGFSMLVRPPASCGGGRSDQLVVQGQVEVAGDEVGGGDDAGLAFHPRCSYQPGIGPWTPATAADHRPLAWDTSRPQYSDFPPLQ